MFFFVLFVFLFILVAGGMVYLVTRFHRFGFIKMIANMNKPLAWVISAVPVLIFIGMCFINAFTSIVCVLHLIIFWLIGDLISLIFKKAFKLEFNHNYEGAVVITFTVIYLGVGWFLAHHVFETDYSIEASKELGRDSLRIVQIADSHLGVTLDGDDFAKQLESIQSTEPDILLITGDFVDDDSRKADMIKACEALGNIKTTYGVYFSFGNHDKGYFQSARDFTETDLRNELIKNNVVILEDETVLIDDSFYIIGRQDRSVKDRTDIADLTQNLDKSKYMIVMDHQPNDYNNESAAQVDLVLSGHTHGGHIFPAGIIGVLMGANDKCYGYEQQNGTDFIVTSGISGWAIPFKTGAVSEYVVIDVKTK